MRKLNLLLTAIFTVAALIVSAQPERGMPSEPGKCYARCLIQDQYETVTEQVLVRDAAVNVRVVPGKTETMTEQVLAKEASTSLRNCVRTGFGFRRKFFC